MSSTQSSLPAYILNQSNELINGESIAPYFIQGKQGGGIYNKGHHANFGHSGTLARFKKLLDVLSARYDQNPVVASISFTETAIGTEIGAGKRYSAISEELFVKGYMMMQAHAGCVFKSTPLFQNLNFPRRALPAFIENMKTFGIGLGGPDVFVDSMKRVLVFSVWVKPLTNILVFIITIHQHLRLFQLVSKFIEKICIISLRKIFNLDLQNHIL